MTDCESFRQRFANASLMGAAVAVVLLAAPLANAAVVTDDFSSNPLSVVPFNLGGVYLNVVTGAASTSDAGAPGWDINPFFLGTDGSRPVGFDLYTPDYTGGIVVAGIIPSISAEELPVGATIGPSSYYKDAYVNAGSDSTDVHDIGFRFLNEATSVEDYGYLEIQQSSSPATVGSVRILGWTYDNTGAPLTVGAASAVPEPAVEAMFGIGLLAFGALAACRCRTR